MRFTDMLAARWSRDNTLLCVGLDPDPARIPAHLQGADDAIFQFCRTIVDATADLVCAFKPQIAYFASQEAEDQLTRLIEHIRNAYPAVPVILDAKRGDIGATAEHYAREAFERYRAHAVTVSPYMGFDSIQPYLAYPNCGVFLLCRTSNPGGSDLQMLNVQSEHQNEHLYEHLARLAARQWNTNGQLGLVVGATYPSELARVRALVGDMALLVPGIGAQGGDIDASVRAGKTAAGGMVINSSRAILYASKAENFAEQARVAAERTRDEINRARV